MNSFNVHLVVRLWLEASQCFTQDFNVHVHVGSDGGGGGISLKSVDTTESTCMYDCMQIHVDMIFLVKGIPLGVSV